MTMTTMTMTMRRSALLDAQAPCAALWPLPVPQRAPPPGTAARWGTAAPSPGSWGELGDILRGCGETAIYRISTRDRNYSLVGRLMSWMLLYL